MQGTLPASSQAITPLVVVLSKTNPEHEGRLFSVDVILDGKTIAGSISPVRTDVFSNLPRAGAHMRSQCTLVLLLKMYPDVHHIIMILSQISNALSLPINLRGLEAFWQLVFRTYT